MPEMEASQSPSPKSVCPAGGCSFFDAVPLFPFGVPPAPNLKKISPMGPAMNEIENAPRSGVNRSGERFQRRISRLRRKTGLFSSFTALYRGRLSLFRLHSRVPAAVPASSIAQTDAVTPPAPVPGLEAAVVPASAPEAEDSAEEVVASVEPDGWEGAVVTGTWLWLVVVSPPEEGSASWPQTLKVYRDTPQKGSNALVT